MKATELILKLHELVKDKGEADMTMMMAVNGHRQVLNIDGADAFGLKWNNGTVQRVIQLHSDEKFLFEP